MPIEPTLADIFDGFRRTLLGDLHVAMPGRVRIYNAASQTADVIPCVRGWIVGADEETVHEELPIIPNVPIAWTRGGGFSLSFPLRGDGWNGENSLGDHVWLVFNECCIAQWRQSGTLSNPGDLSRSSISYPFAIPAAAPDAQALTDPGSNLEAVLAVATGGKLRVSTAGAAHVEPVALAQKVADQLSALKQAISDATPVANDGGAALKAAMLASLSDWPGNVGSTTLSAEGEA
jgi:hypothetical protein